MRHRLARAILLLYPRRVRQGHGPEIIAVIDDLIAIEARSATRLYLRLVIDGLTQRAASTVTVWTVVAALTTTSFGVLAISDFAVANAHKTGPAHQTHHPPRPQRAQRRPVRGPSRPPRRAS
jgi:hypothetical protein